MPWLTINQIAAGTISGRNRGSE